MRSIEHGFPGGPRWSDPYYCEWAVVVGDRVRRLRKARALTLVELARLVERPQGGNYSAGYISRLERGWGTAPLYTYLAIADVLEVPPGRLLGPDDAEKQVTDAELTLVIFTRRLRLTPAEAIARIASP